MANGQLDLVLRHIHRLAGADGCDGLKDGQLLERFVAAGEEAAFAALVRRHGPMVLGVCRRVLGSLHDAEDAFQATFLVLLRRARALDRRGSLTNWLYTVAYHVALRARAEAARRQRQERQVAQMPQAVSPAGEVWPDLQPVLDEELSRLPDSYRSAVLLCYLQGRTNAEAARLLGWPVGTVKGRLARARDLLRRRLARRGITLTGGALAAALTDHASAAVPAPLAHATVRAAAAGLTAGATSAAVLSLAEGALKTMFVTKTKIATAFLLVTALLALGVGALADPGQPRPVKGVIVVGDSASVLQVKDGMMKLGPGARPKKAAARTGEQSISGRVLGPEKRPLAGARVALLWWPDRQPAPGPQVLGEATTDKEGKFRLKAKAAPAPVSASETLVAAAPGHGPAWSPADKTSGVEITLSPEEIIRGRLVDLQGQPAANVKLQVSRLGPRLVGRNINQYLLQAVEFDYDADGVLDLLVTNDAYWIAATDGSVRTARMNPPPGPVVGSVTWLPAGAALIFPESPAGLWFWPRSVTTDAQGRFVLKGVGRGQGVGLQVRDERYALQALDVSPQAGDRGAEIPLVLQPPRILEGTVTDAATGRPLTHARLKVRSPGNPNSLVSGSVAVAGLGGDPAPDWRGRRGLGPSLDLALTFALIDAYGHAGAGELPDIEARADDKGHFRLPLYQAGHYNVGVAGAPGEPFLPKVAGVDWPKGEVVRHQVHVSLVRGVPVRGKVTEEPGGKAVAGARVDFWCKGLKLPEGVRHPGPAATRADGTFAALLPPGSWHVLVNAGAPEYVYRTIAADRLLEPRPPAQAGNLAAWQGKPPANFYPDGWAALDVKAGADAREVTVSLHRAPLVRGRLVGPDGKVVRRAKLLFEAPLPAEADSATASPQHFRRAFLDVYGSTPSVGAITTFALYREPHGLVVADLTDGTFSFPARNPEGTYRLHFLDAAGGQAAAVSLQGKQADGEPLTVKLAPCGSARVRLTDARGKPLAGYRPVAWLLPPGKAPAVAAHLDRLIGNGLRADNAIWLGHLDPLHYGDGPRTDADGRVTLPALIPGMSYRISQGDGKARDFTVHAGQTLTLPDLAIDRRDLTNKMPAPARPAAGAPARK
jgi:RNA polymerase sigma factor (sigma-70 family)